MTEYLWDQEPAPKPWFLWALVVAAVLGWGLALVMDAYPRPSLFPPPPPSLALVDEPILLGASAVDVAVDPTTHAVYVSNGREGTVSVIAADDSGTHRVVNIVSVDQEAGLLAVDSDAGLVYATNGGHAGAAGTVSVIDGGRGEVVDTVVLGQEDADAIGFDPLTGLLFVAGNGGITIVEANTRRIVATIPLPGESEVALAVDSVGGAVYVSSASGVWVLDTKTRRIIDTVKIGGSQLDVDPAAGVVLLCEAGGGRVAVVDTTTHKLVKRIDVGGRGPFHVMSDPLAGRAYVTGAKNGAIAVIDTNTLTVVEEITRPDQWEFWFGPLDVDPATGSIYVAGEGAVRVIPRR